MCVVAFKTDIRVALVMLKMPKITNNTRIRQYITEFGENVFSCDGVILFCKFCETKINTDMRYLVTQHLKTEKHKSAEKRKQDQMKNKSQQLVGNAMTSKNSFFNHDLCNTLLSANIPCKLVKKR